MPGTARGQSWTIESGETVSDDSIEQQGTDLLCGLDFPAAFTGATVSFKAADTDSVAAAIPLDKEGTLYSVTANDGHGTSLDPNVFAGRRFIWIVSAGAEAADRLVTPRFRGYPPR